MQIDSIQLRPCQALESSEIQMYAKTVFSEDHSVEQDLWRDLGCIFRTQAHSYDNFLFEWKINERTINHQWNDLSPESAVGLIEINTAFADTIEKWAIQAERIYNILAADYQVPRKELC